LEINYLKNHIKEDVTKPAGHTFFQASQPIEIKHTWLIFLLSLFNALGMTKSGRTSGKNMVLLPYTANPSYLLAYSGKIPVSHLY